MNKIQVFKEEDNQISVMTELCYSIVYLNRQETKELIKSLCENFDGLILTDIGE